MFLHYFMRGLELEVIKKKFLYILALTALLVVISLISEPFYLTGFYIVLTFVWIIFFISSINKLLKYKRKKLRLKEAAYSELDQLGNCFLEFNNDWIKVTTDKISSEIKWGYFRAYLEDEITVYIFMEQVSSALSFSREEIGEEALHKLKAIVKEKLPHLKEIASAKNKA